MKGYSKLYFETKHLDYANVLKVIADSSERALFYFHEGGKLKADRPHIHALLYNYKLTDDTLRSLVKKAFGLTSAHEHSIGTTYKKDGKTVKMTEHNYHGYMVYMTKGKYQPLEPMKGFLIEETELARGLWLEPTPLTETKTIYTFEEIKKVKKMTQWQISHEVETRAMIDNLDFTVDNLLPIIADVCHENKTLCHYRNASNICQDIESRQDTKRFSQMVKKLMGL